MANGIYHATKTKKRTALAARRSFELVLPRAFSPRVAPGAFFRAESVGAEIVLRPVDAVESDQAWFRTPEWQEKERAAEADIRAGRVSGPFRSVKEFVKDLKR